MVAALGYNPIRLQEHRLPTPPWPPTRAREIGLVFSRGQECSLVRLSGLLCAPGALGRRPVMPMAMIGMRMSARYR